MKQESLTQAAHAAVVLSGGIYGGNEVGFFQYINANAPGITVFIALASFCAAVTFYAFSYRKQQKTETNELRIKTLEEKQDSMDDHLIEIIVLLKTNGDNDEKTTKRNKNT